MNENAGEGMGGIQHVKVSYTNCFLLKCRGGYLLVDTGVPGKYNSFLKKLSKINVDVREIKYLLITHYHSDHAGFAAELIRDSGAKIIVHKKGVPFLEEGKWKEKAKKGVFPNLCIKFLVTLHDRLFPHTSGYPPVEIPEGSHILEKDDFDLLKEIGIDGIILYTPGHTEDSISVLLSDGSAIVGDVAMNFLNICHTRHSPIYIQDFEEMYGSWKKLIEHGAKTIYPAHGKPFSAEELTLKS